MFFWGEMVFINIVLHVQMQCIWCIFYCNQVLDVGIKLRTKLGWAWIWVLEALFEENMLQNHLSIYNIILHWEPKIGVCDWESATHSSEKVQSLWYAKCYDVKEIMKKKKFRVAPELCYVHNMRQMTLDVHHTKVNILALQLKVWKNEWWQISCWWQPKILENYSKYLMLKRS